MQLTGYIDQYIASWLPMGTVAALSNAQLLYTLPVSLFGVSISAAELPALSEQATAATYDAFRARLDAGLRRLAFFIVPSVVAFAALGDIIAGAILQTGRFTPEDARYVWGILAGSSIGLMPSTMGRLYSVGHYALTDAKTSTPFRHGPPGDRRRARLRVLRSSCPASRCRPELGHGVSDRVVRPGRVGGVRIAAAPASMRGSATTGVTAATPGPPVGRGTRGCGRGVGGTDGAAAAASDRHRRDRPAGRSA